MYLNITASKDTYIQNKILNNRYRTSDANVGYAGTLDLFKLYNESSLPTSEAVTQSEIVSVTFPAYDSESDNLGGKHFIIYDEDDTKYYVWFNIVGADPASVDPAVDGATAIQADIEETDGKIDVAAEVAGKIDALEKFSVVDKETGEIEITVISEDPAKNAANGDITDSGFELSITQQGQSPGTFNLDADSDGTPETAIELSRILVDFDLSVLDEMTTLDTTSPEFKATLNLYDILDGQMAPTNFNVEIFPLAQSFTEGIGRDTGAFGDLDICNFVTASYAGEPVLWNSAGADTKGPIGGDNLDVYSTDGDGADITVSKSFVEGTEKFSFDVTDLVKEMIGDSPSIDANGFRISFSEQEETDGKTYFLKRFASRHALNQYLRPRLCISWNDSFRDNTKNAIFDADNKLLFRNSVRGSTSWVSNEDITLTLTTGSLPEKEYTVERLTAHSAEDTPDESLVEISGIYSADVNDLTSDDSGAVSSQPEIIRVEFVDHNEDDENLDGYHFTIANNEGAPTTYSLWFGIEEEEPTGTTTGTEAKIEIEAGDTATEIAIKAAATINTALEDATMEGLTVSVFSLGVIHIELSTDGEPSTTATTGDVPDDDFDVVRYQEGNEITLQDHIIASGSIDFTTTWADSTDATLHTGTLTVKSPVRSAYNAVSPSMSVSLLNVKPAYKASERAKFRVFVKDLNQEHSATREKLEIDSIIYDEIYYRIRDIVSGDLVIPFEQDNNGTRLSTDSGGMYFEIIMSSLFPGRAYTVDLLAISDGNEIVYECEDTRFRVDL